MNSVYKITIPLLFFIQYFGLGAIAQIIVVLFITGKLFSGSKFFFSDVDKLVFFLVFIVFVFKLLGVPLAVNVHLFRFYWGFILFYFFFIVTKFELNYLVLFWLTISVTVLESVLINTIVPLEMMKNIPISHLEILKLESNWVLYMRSYGLASSPTSSATILVILLACVYRFQNDIYKDWYVLITAFTLILFGSGTGFLLFFSFLFFRFKLYSGFKLILGLTFLTGLIMFITSQDITQGGMLMRLSGNYFETLIDLKLNQIKEVLDKLSKSIFEILFGANYRIIPETRVMSDFGWIDFIECYGVSGVPLFLFFIFVKRKFFFLPILLLILGYFHYPAIGSIPGQILIGGILSHHLAKKEDNLTPEIN